MIIKATHQSVIDALCHLAKLGDRLSSQHLATDVGYHQCRFIEQYLQRMVHAGFLNSARGFAGGYAITDFGRAATVADVLTALGGYDDPLGGDTPGAALNKIFETLLQSFTIEQLAKNDAPFLANLNPNEEPKL